MVTENVRAGNNLLDRISDVCHGKPASRQAFTSASQLAGLLVILLGSSNFILCLIMSFIMRYKQERELSLKFKTAWRSSEI